MSLLDSDLNEHASGVLAESTQHGTSGIEEFLAGFDLDGDFTGAESSSRRHPYSDLAGEASYIRLVTILPDDNDRREISCTIDKHAFDRAPEYTAVSYTWGAPTFDCNIMLDGHSFEIRRNLWRLLWQLRKQGSHVNQYLWIDALCIDQSDVSERNHQVGLMGEIFRRASWTIVWLGPSYKGSDRALAELSKFTMGFKPEHSMTKIWSGGGGIAIRNLCQRRYWSRLWCLQELVLSRAPVIYCGSKRLPLEELESFVRATQSNHLVDKIKRRRNGEIEAFYTSPAVAMLRQMEDARRGSTLLDQMVKFTNLDCTERRDKAYALLSIVPHGSERLLPNYNLSMGEFLNSILRYHHLLQPAMSLSEIRMQCTNLAAVVGVQDRHIFSEPLQSSEFRAAWDKLGTGWNWSTTPETLEHFLLWALYYGHKGIICGLANNDLLGDTDVAPLDLNLLVSIAFEQGNHYLATLLLESEDPTIYDHLRQHKAVYTIAASARESHAQAILDILWTDSDQAGNTSTT